MADDSTFDDGKAEEARAQAEARRQRILEKSRARMGVVSGDPSAAEALQDDDKEALSGARRMQAMRRRRFKKSAASKEDEQPEAQTKAEEPAQGATEASPSDSAEKATETVAASAAPVDTADDTKAETDETKKKYKGVAKTRREMIKKKQKTASDQTESKVASTPLLMTKRVSRLPILLNLVAVLLLFLAGLDIGWNQDLFTDVMIQRRLAPQDRGIGILNRSKAAPKSILQDGLLDTQKGDEWSETTQEEFAAEEEEEYVPNIDPLFQVDFDVLTKGDGIFKMLARGAVSLHRVNLYLFFYLPKSILLSLISIPQMLLATPPVLCIVSLVVRQSARIVFGADLPDPAKSSKDTKDVLAMVKQSVMTFLSGTFPTAVSFYDTWTHLRSDMYVILCGVFVGLAYTYHFESGEIYGGAVEIEEDVVAEEISGGTDEL